MTSAPEPGPPLPSPPQRRAGCGIAAATFLVVIVCCLGAVGLGVWFWLARGD